MWFTNHSLFPGGRIDSRKYGWCCRVHVVGMWAKLRYMVGHNLQPALLPSLCHSQQLPSKQIAQITSSPLHLLRTLGHSSRSVLLLKIKLALIFTSIHPPHPHPKGLKSLLPESSDPLGSMDQLPMEQTPNYHLVEHLEKSPHSETSKDL